MNHLDRYAGPEPIRRVSDTLIRRGGRMGTGSPIYRLVRSEYVFEKVGGLWHEWDKNLNIADRGGITTEEGKPVESSFRPDRVVAELRETQVYSHFDEPGWVLERWYPGVFFGSPVAWESHKVPGSNIQLLGPFPTQGRYLCIAGPFPKPPSIGFIEDFIASWESRRDSFPTDVEKHIQMRVEEATRLHEARTEHAIRENTERLEASVAPIDSTTLEAGRWRQKHFESAGHTSHVGN